MKRLTISARACTEILALLIKVAWADGHLEEREKESIRAASAIFNLSKELRTRLDTALDKPLALDQILVEALGPHDRAFAYVAAVWLTNVDDEVDPKEQDLLAQIADLLQIPLSRQTELRALARDFHDQHKGDKHWAEQLGILFKSIPARLDGAEEAEILFE